MRSSRLLAGLSLVAVSVAASAPASADPVTWSVTPFDSSYENGANWNAGAPPIGQGYFGASSITTLSIGADQTVGGWTFNAGAPAYAISNDSGWLQFTGVGIVVNGGSLALTNNDLISFLANSSAGTAAITNNGQISFGGSSSAGSSVITNNGYMTFDNASTAGASTITNVSTLYFTGNSNGGSAQIIGSNPSSFIDFSQTTGAAGDNKLTVGSLQGQGYFFLGSNQLTLGGNNLSTTVLGPIADCAVGPTTCAAGTGTGASLVKVGTGILTLANPSNRFTGGITLIGGEVSVAGDNNLSVNGGNLTFDGGTLQITGTTFQSTTHPIIWASGGGGFDIVDPTNTFAVATALTGVGGLSKIGAGALTLLGANTYSGATTVSAGTLQQGATGAFSNASAFTVATGAVLDLKSYAAAIGSLAGAGNVALGSATLTAGGDNSATTFSGVMSGSGRFAKTGTGTMTLSGVNTYTGATTVNGGVLSVDGSIASSSMTTVNAGGTLAGSGTVGNTTINGGTLAPGSSTGLLNIAGSLAFTSASTYAVDASPSSAGRVNVTGAATLGGTTVNASFANGSYIAKQYTILNATGGVSGTFGSQVNTNLPTSFTSNLSYDANNAYLNLTLSYTPPNPTPNSGPSFGNGLNQNQSSVGTTLVNYFNRNGGIPLAFGALTPTGLTQASGETNVGGQQPAFDAATQFAGTLSDPTMAGRGANVAPAMGYAEESDDQLAYASDGHKRSGSERDAYAMMTKAASRVPGFVPHWSSWVSGFGGTQTTDGNAASGTNTSTSRIGGAAVGADYWLSPQTVAGFAAAGGASSFSVANGGSGWSDLFQFGGFVRHEIGTSYITATAAYGWQSVTTNRTVGTEQLRAQFDTNSYTGRVEIGDRFKTPWLGGIALTPYAAAQLTYLDLPAYAETAPSGTSSFALAYASQGIASPRTELGLRSDRSFDVKDAVLTLRGRAAWAHDYNTDRSASATFQSLPGASFVVNGAQPASDAALTTAEAELRFKNGISIGATFDGEFSDVTRGYAGKGVVRYAW